MKDGTVLGHCFSRNCSWDECLAALKPNLPLACAQKGSGRTRKDTKGLTLEQHAAAKCLDSEFLSGLGLKDGEYGNSPCLVIPYLGETGGLIRERFRLSLEKSRDDRRFVWGRGSGTALYGLDRLHIYPNDYVLVVEGESDCHTLWKAEFPAMGVSGASSFKNEWASLLTRFGRILVLVEPDPGGEALLAKMAGSPARDRLRVIRLSVKDPSALFLEDSDRFAERMREAIKAAEPVGDLGLLLSEVETFLKRFVVLLLSTSI